MAEVHDTFQCAHWRVENGLCRFHQKMQARNGFVMVPGEGRGTLSVKKYREEAMA
jgi:hypothetical protein